MSVRHTAVEVIRAKRDGHEVPSDAIAWLVDGFTRGEVVDAQMSAFAMAVVLNGMSRPEIRALTDAMIASGTCMTYPGLTVPTVDKHSTGGVGDKVTLPLVPLVAAFGVAVPQLSGRGLGYTGGTLDKLESIPGWRADLDADAFDRQLVEVGAVIAAAGRDLAPADRRLYALRDVTGTVESLPLIASSIMSKKIAEGTDGLVLDVKFGSGAFLPAYDDALELARTMVDLGADEGMTTTALLTDMSVPLGLSVGNANEVAESVAVLAGGGPADVVELVVALAREMLTIAGQPDADVAAALADGRAMDVWRRMIRAQGGDPDAALPAPREMQTVLAPAPGFVDGVDALAFGIAAWRLGAGRTRAELPVQHAAGIDLHVRPGDPVIAGQPLFTLRTDDGDRIPDALRALDGAWWITDDAPSERPPLIRARLTAEGPTP